MSTEQSSNQSWFSEPNGQVPSIPSQFQQGEETDPLHINRQEDITTKQQTKKREHTAPKVLLSVMHKILYWQTTTSKMFKKLLSQANKRQNNSTPIKFYLLAVKADLLDKLRDNFVSEAEAKLRDYFQRKSWSDRRLETAREWKNRIQMALEQRNDNLAFEIVWKGNNHPGKLAESEKNVADFKKKFWTKRRSQFVKR